MKKYLLILLVNINIFVFSADKQKQHKNKSEKQIIKEIEELAKTKKVIDCFHEFFPKGLKEVRTCSMNFLRAYANCVEKNRHKGFYHDSNVERHIIDTTEGAEDFFSFGTSPNSSGCGKNLKTGKIGCFFGGVHLLEARDYDSLEALWLAQNRRYLLHSFKHLYNNRK